MKKKIAVVFCRLSVGGAEKSLIHFLNNLDPERYDVTLITFGEHTLLRQLSDTVRVHFFGNVDSGSVLLNDIKHFRVTRLLKGGILRFLIRVTKDEYVRFTYSVMTYPPIKEKYNCAIAYKLGYEDTAMLLNCVDAEKKCAWVHGTVEKDYKTALMYRFLKPISKIFCVSEDAKRRVDKQFPHVADKTEVFYNLIDADEIIDQARLPMDCGFGRTAIVTVGRLSPEKGQQMVPKTVRILLDQGCDIHWYLVGDGPLRSEVEQECEKYGVQDRVILLGTKMNPYPYIKNCDIYVQPSFTEGWGLTVQEARILAKPIVVTPVPVMAEQINSGENGLIVDAMTPEAIADGIRQLLDHPELMERFTEALKNEPADNSSEMQKLYDFIES